MKALLWIGTGLLVIHAAWIYWHARRAWYSALCVLAVVYYWRTYERRQHAREVVYPLIHALSRMLAVPYNPKARNSFRVTVPVDYARNRKTSIKLVLPDDYIGDRKAEITRLVSRKLGIDLDASWNEIGRPSVSFVHAPAPPSRINLATMLRDIERGKPHALYFGRTSRDAPYWASYDTDAPHIALSVGTGGGKSALIRAIILQLLCQHHDVERIDILDPKEVSQRCFKGIPGIVIHRKVSLWFDAIRDFRAEMDRRYELLDSMPPSGDCPFPRRFLIIEEQNSLTAMVKEHWSLIRGKEDPKKAPPLSDLSYVLFKGRQAGMHVVSVLQQGNAAAMGGSDLRDQYGIKIMARYSTAAWRMFVQTTPVPRSSKHPGRARIVIGDEHHELQLPIVTETEARERAVTLRPEGWVAQRREHREELAAENGPGWIGSHSGTSEDAPLPAMSIREAIESGFLTASLESARMARFRDSEFPKQVGKRGQEYLYNPSELQRWELNRARNGSGVVQ